MSVCCCICIFCCSICSCACSCACSCDIAASLGSGICAGPLKNLSGDRKPIAFANSFCSSSTFCAFAVPICIPACCCCASASRCEIVWSLFPVPRPTLMMQSNPLRHSRGLTGTHWPRSRTTSSRCWYCETSFSMSLKSSRNPSAMLRAIRSSLMSAREVTRFTPVAVWFNVSPSLPWL